MAWNAMTFVIDAIVAKSRNATSLSPALLGTVLGKSPMTSLLFTILFTPEVVAGVPTSPPPAGRVALVVVPDVTTGGTGKESDHALHELVKLGFNVKAVDKRGAIPKHLAKAVKVTKQDIAPGQQVPEGTTITLTLDV